MSKKTKNIIDRATLLAALVPKPVIVEIDGVGSAFMKEFSALERLDLFGKGKDTTDPAEQFKFMASLLPAALVDEKGKPILQEEDLEALVNGKGQLVQDLVNKMLDVNGMSAKAKEEAEGNSEATPGTDSSTT